MKILYILILLLSFLQTVNGQHNLKGLIVDKFNDPLPFVMLELTHTDSNFTLKSQTNFDGVYLIDSLITGNYKMSTAAIGWQAYELHFRLIDDTIISLTLKEDYLKMEEIVVKEKTQPLIDKDYEQQISIDKVDEDQLEHYSEHESCKLDTIQKEGLLNPKELKEHLTEYLKYPYRAMNLRYQGKVYVMLTIDSLGYVSQVEIVKGVCYCLDVMVKSAFLTLPRLKMQPKLPNGRYENTGYQWFEEGEYLFPVNFILE